MIWLIKVVLGDIVKDFKEIINMRKTNDALPEEESYFTKESGQKKPVKTSKGWEVYIQ